MYLIDTNVISELREGKPRPDPAVLAWAGTALPQSLFLSVVTKFELEMGELRLARRDPAQAIVLRTWRQLVLAQFTGRVLPFATP